MPIPTLVARREKRVRSHIITARAPKPLYPERPSLTSLPADVISHIINLLQDVCPKSVITLASVCSYLYPQARYVQHRTLSIRFTQPTTDSVVASHKILNWLDYLVENGLPAAIRTLEVKGGSFTTPSATIYKQHNAAWARILSRLDAIIPLMTGLHDIKWEAQRGHAMTALPQPIFKILAERPRVRLHLTVAAVSGHRFAEIDYRARAEPAIATLAALACSPNLVSLSVNNRYRSSGAVFVEMSARIKDLLLTCPNLRNLSLDFASQDVVFYGLNPHQGDQPLDYIGFGLHSGEQPLRPLEELGFAAYPFGHDNHGLPPIWGHHSHTQGYPAELAGIEEQDYWVLFFDWSALRRLHVKREMDVRFLPKLAPLLYALREVRFESCSSLDAAACIYKFLSDLPPCELEEIAVPSLTMRIGGIASVVRHGRHLRRLEVLREEKWYRPPFSLGGPSELFPPWRANNLTELRDGLPCLEELVIMMDEPYREELLPILAGFSRLRRLEIWFELGLVNFHARQKYTTVVSMTAASAVEMFRQMRDRGSHVRHLHVHCGGPPPQSPNPFAEHWARENWTSFVCETYPNGRIRLTCPRLSHADNLKLERIVNGQEEYYADMAAPEKDSLQFRVALNGPVPAEEWGDFSGQRYELPWWDKPVGYLEASVARGLIFARLRKQEVKCNLNLARNPRGKVVRVSWDEWRAMQRRKEEEAKHGRVRSWLKQHVPTKAAVSR
ncbi:hypothetical protein B0H66DRAFT_216963 [Apodospora peruviana]|uniref:Uncharacterized protein n=1 Tax=Apodospora peruviana TaxID=516989 RepID=A0AAE0IDF1_9PEZI|nr:hypothetical protein B0H66DRAFT_216963 [Apodospora peruviana]